MIIEHWKKTNCIVCAQIVKIWVRSKSLTPLEITGGNSILLEGFEIKIKILRRGIYIGGIQIFIQGIQNSTGGIRISI